MRYCVYDYPNTRIIPDYRMWVTISAWNYAKLDCTSVDSGVGVHFFPSRAESPPLAATTPTREISWFHVQIHVAKKSTSVIQSVMEQSVLIVRLKGVPPFLANMPI